MLLLVVVAIGGIVSGVLQLDVIIRAGDLKRSDEISGCRAAYRVALVDAPTFRALKAFSEDDPDGLGRAIGQGDPDRYEELVKLSNSDPSAFLRECRSPGAVASRP